MKTWWKKSRLMSYTECDNLGLLHQIAEMKNVPDMNLKLVFSKLTLDMGECTKNITKWHAAVHNSSMYVCVYWSLQIAHIEHCLTLIRRRHMGQVCFTIELFGSKGRGKRGGERCLHRQEKELTIVLLLGLAGGKWDLFTSVNWDVIVVVI